MTPGHVVLIRLPRFEGGPIKLRPALMLAKLPGPFQNVLICGVSTQLRELEPDWDELIDAGAADFPDSGLQRASAIRLSYLYAAQSTEIVGSIGRIDADRFNRLLNRLAARLMRVAS